MPHSTSAKPRVYTAAPEKVHTEAHTGPPDVLPMRPAPIPVATFGRLHNARCEGDYALAKRLIRQMREYGYSVVPLGAMTKKGARA